MTTIRDMVGRSLGLGETFDLALREEDGRLVADHPYESSPVDVIVVEGADSLPDRPPETPVAVELLDRLVDGRIAGRIVTDSS